RDPDRAARFEREARLLAALNHPNIAALYELEQAGNQHFLVMELVQRETLADLLRRGPLPVEEALQIANQIAQAVESAHASGIVHRDWGFSRTGEWPVYDNAVYSASRTHAVPRC